MAQDTQALIAGAGPTGLMLALELAQRGIRVRLIDKLAAASPYSRALVVHAKSLELLQNLGLDGEFQARGFRTIGVSGYVDGRLGAEIEFGDIGMEGTPFPFVLFISQADTEAILTQALDGLGVHIERSVSLAGFTQDAHGVDATLEYNDGRREHLRCDYLAGCDGAHSVVRHGLGLSFEGGAYEQDFALADVRLDWKLPRTRLMFFLGRPGVLAVFPMPAGIHRLILTVPAGVVDTSKELTLEEVQMLARRLSATDMTLSDPAWLSRFHLHHRGVNRYGVGRAFVAGDAAHIHSPAGGQGMNTGIQDAANLAWKLALALNGQASARLLESYHAERWPIGQVLLKRTDRLFVAAATKNPVAIALRNFVVPRILRLLPRFRSLRERVFRFISQLGIHYRGSPVVIELGEWSAGPHAGERAPDVTLYRTGHAIRLFDAMRGPEHRLLLFSGRGAGVPTTVPDLRDSRLTPFPCRVVTISRDRVAVDVLTDLTGEAYAAYGVPESGALYLIRPDGYVGARAPLAEAAGILVGYVRNL